VIATVINALAIVAGTIVGLVFKNKFSDRLQDIAVQATGLAVIVIGLNTTIGRLISEPCNPILFVVSLVIGGIIGTVINIECKLNNFGKRIEQMVGNRGSGKVAKSFVTATLLYCVGSMAIVGSLESGLNGSYSTLLTKSVLDGVNSVIIASSMGFGVLFSAISVLFYQGFITLMAGVIKPYLTGDILREVTLVGGVLIMGLGIDMLGLKKLNIANMLPSLIIPVIYYAAVYIIF
jgi:hypothetical protein